MSRWSATVEPPWDLQAWRDASRAALRAGVAPHDLDWNAGAQASLLALPAIANAPELHPLPRVKAGVLQLAGSVLCHRDQGSHALMYRLLWRMTHGEPQVLENPADPDSHRARTLAQEIRRDSHKMKAFVRFRALPGPGERFMAWFEPGHFILDRVAPFFVRRFAGMQWAILTPYRSAAWDGSALSYGAGADAGQVPADDAGEELWRTYYANIFNPARINPKMMRQEMPQRYWKHLPEAQLIPGLLRNAGSRVAEMTAREAQAPRRRVPAARAPAPLEHHGLATVREQAKACRACPLWEAATQTVFGEGPEVARIMLVGEQPGDAEDLCGRPFVGPAGKLLDQVLGELGISRSTLYLTNAVKHFHFEQRGKVRLHKNPAITHVNACAPWLSREIATVIPSLIVTLGATAARAVLGPGFALMRERGKLLIGQGGVRILPTVHPAWVLRQPDAPARDAAYQLLRNDLALMAELQVDSST
ncbi:MAG: UdgX family uracil-DNA binding protein [Thermomonas sp.]